MALDKRLYRSDFETVVRTDADRATDNKVYKK